MLVGAALAGIATGCNSEKLPRLAPVTGSVTMDGQPVPNATVTFDGAKEGEPVSLGRTDATGKYELYYSRNHKGATVGEHAVRVSTHDETGDDDNRQVQKETIPSRYNVKSELKANVKRGTNKHDFELKSGGEIIQPGEDAVPKGKKGTK
jgi:hypothetical protein